MDGRVHDEPFVVWRDARVYADAAQRGFSAEDPSEDNYLPDERRSFRARYLDIDSISTRYPRKIERVDRGRARSSRKRDRFCAFLEDDRIIVECLFLSLSLCDQRWAGIARFSGRDYCATLSFDIYGIFL